MSAVPGTEFFPLRLTPFEWYMLEDDRPEYPMTFSLRLGLQGRIRRGAFEAALADACARHLLLCARIRRRSRREPRWELVGQITPYLDWDDASVPWRCPAGEAIDLTAEAGLRVWVRQGPETASVMLLFHHACCDGIGALQFAGDLLAAYGIRTAAGGSQPELLRLDASRLSARGDFAQGKPSWRDRAGYLIASLREAYRWCAVNPAPLNLPEATDSTGPAGGLFSGICSRVLGENELQSLLAAARRQEVTLNDLLLCNMFLTIADWNDRHGSAACGSWLRVAMPANLRMPGDEAMPAANRVTMSFLARRAGECRDARTLLAGIRRETSHIKGTRRGLHLLTGLKAARAIWGGLPRHFTERRCLATIVLSNLGDVETRLAARFPHTSGRLVAGDLVLEEISAVSPLRRQTRAVLTVTTYARNMTLTVRCDPHLLSSSQAEEFLDLYGQRLIAALAGPAGAG